MVTACRSIKHFEKKKKTRGSRSIVVTLSDMEDIKMGNLGIKMYDLRIKTGQRRFKVVEPIIKMDEIIIRMEFLGIKMCILRIKTRTRYLELKWRST